MPIRIEWEGEGVELARAPGDGPPLILLHGAGGNADVWSPLLPVLGGFDVYAPSLPGRGESSGPVPATAADAARFVDRLLAGLGISHALVLGHSYGGAIAIELALGSERVAGLALVATGARLRVHPSVLAAAAAAVETGAPMPTRFAFGPEAPRDAIDAYEGAIARTPPAASLGDWRACDAFDRMDALGGIRAPCLVIGGEEDALTPPKYLRFLAEGLPRAQLELVPRVGHMLPWERPAEIARILRSWAAAVA